MADPLVKNANKDFNRELFYEELAGAGLAVGITWAGFDRLNLLVMTPSAIHGHTAGELRFKYDPALSAGQEATLDGLITAHDATQKTNLQAAKDQDETDRLAFIDTFQNWDSFNSTQQRARTKHLFRVCARLIDSSTDV